jgi:hypothetical protein
MRRAEERENKTIRNDKTKCWIKCNPTHKNTDPYKSRIILVKNNLLLLVLDLHAVVEREGGVGFAPDLKWRVLRKVHEKRTEFFSGFFRPFSVGVLVEEKMCPTSRRAKWEMDETRI